MIDVTGVTLQHETQASRNSRDDDLVFLDRPLEKIDERQESESENEDVKHHETSDVTVTPLEVTSPHEDVTPSETHKVEEEETEILESVISECDKGNLGHLNSTIYSGVGSTKCHMNSFTSYFIDLGS